MPLKPINWDNIREDALMHCYSRYGYAVMATSAGYYSNPLEMDSETVRRALIRCIEEGLGNLRFYTKDDPTIKPRQTYQKMPYEMLRDRPEYVTAKAADGYYVCPNICVSAKVVGQLWSAALEIMSILQSGVSFDKPTALKRSYSPFTAKINGNNKCPQDPKQSLLEAALCLVATLTPWKAAQQINLNKGSKIAAWTTLCIIPDLPVEQLCHYVDLLRGFLRDGINQTDLFISVVGAEAIADDEEENSDKKSGKAKKNQGKYIPPPFRYRNFANCMPGARDETILGLLAALGNWQAHTAMSTRGKAVLDSLTNRRIYLVSYDKIQSVKYSNVVTCLAAEGQLAEAISQLLGVEAWNKKATKLYNERDQYTFVYLTKRWLQEMDKASFTDFRSVRAHYTAATEPLFWTYFTEKQNMDEKLVAGARALGAWMNGAVHRYAARKHDSDRGGNKYWMRYERTSNNCYYDFESMLGRSSNITDAFSAIFREVRQMGGGSVPQEAVPFIQAALSGAISVDDARGLVSTWMHVPREYAPKVEETALSPEADSALIAEVGADLSSLTALTGAPA